LKNLYGSFGRICGFEPKLLVQKPRALCKVYAKNKEKLFCSTVFATTLYGKPVIFFCRGQKTIVKKKKWMHHFKLKKVALNLKRGPLKFSLRPFSGFTLFDIT
jgi:hypothetical protein